MSDETITKTDNAPGDSTGFDVGAAFFGIPATPEDHESDKSGAGAQSEESEDAAVDITDDGGEAEGDNEPGEEVEVWEFNGAQFTADQVSDALKHRETFERFNQSIAPLVDNIKAFGETAERMKVMAVTECERQIAELKKALGSGQLDSRQYQQAHQQLTAAESRKQVLEQAAEQEANQRKQALINARTHNARQVATNLVKSGWTKEQMNQAQALAQQCMTHDQFADSLSPGFMEILRDAAELRAQKAKVAEALQDKARKAVKVGSGAPAATTTKKKVAKAGDPDWMAQNFWKGLK